MTIQRTTQETQDLVESTMAMLLKAVRQDNIPISADMRVREKDAARMMGYAPGSFKNIRNEGKGPIYYNRPVAGSKISYRLMDLAMWVEERRENW